MTYKDGRYLNYKIDIHPDFCDARLFMRPRQCAHPEHQAVGYHGLL